MGRLRKSSKTTLLLLALKMYDSRVFTGGVVSIGSMPENDLLAFHTKVAAIKRGDSVLIEYKQVGYKKYFSPVGFTIDPERVMKHTLRNIETIANKEKVSFYQRRLLLDVEKLLYDIIDRTEL